MATEFSPKQNFVTLHPAHATELQAHREDAWLKVAFAYTLAEMAYLGADAAQLNGARNFIGVLQNLWEKSEPAKRLPVQQLDSFERPLEEVLKERTAAEKLKQK